MADDALRERPVMSKNSREAAKSAESAILRMAPAELQRLGLCLESKKKLTNIWIFFFRYETMGLAVMTGGFGLLSNNYYIIERSYHMIYSKEVEEMCTVAQGVHHGCAPIPEEAKWVQAKEVKDISGLTHGVGWCAPQQGACKLTLNVKEGIIQEALVETIGCSGMTHSAAMASEILPGLTVMEALNTDLVCDAINTAMRELFLQIVYGRTQSAFSEDGLPVGAGLEDLGKGLRSQVGTMYGTLKKGPRYLEMAEGYVTGIALDENDEIIGYKFVSLGKMTDFIKKGDDPNTAYEKACGQYGRVDDAAKIIDPRCE